MCPCARPQSCTGAPRCWYPPQPPNPSHCGGGGGGGPGAATVVVPCWGFGLATARVSSPSSGGSPSGGVARAVAAAAAREPPNGGSRRNRSFSRYPSSLPGAARARVSLLPPAGRVLEAGSLEFSGSTGFQSASVLDFK